MRGKCGRVESLRKDNIIMIVHCKDGDRDEPIYNIDTYPYTDMLMAETCRDRHGVTYLNIPCAFDIETTNIGNDNTHYAFMYHWQVCINDKVIFGRTWEEYIAFIERLQVALQLNNARKLVIYVHNLAYEFQFFRRFFNITKVLARKKRVPMKVETNGCIEYRCSYILSNMSLEKFCENSRNVEHIKNVGKYDYKKIRTPKTPLTIDEASYCYNDVRGLCECIADKLTEDTIPTIPLTSTGYVRRDCKNAVLANKKNKKKQQLCKISVEVYAMLKEAFRGGNTHANALYVDQIISGVKSRDISSSYPARMLLSRYPMRFIKESESKIYQYLQNKDYAILTSVRFVNIRQKVKYGIPYIDIAHCRGLKNPLKDSEINDNGRILRADTLEMTVTDIDLKIILDTYDYDEIYFKDMHVAKYEYLPQELRKVIIEYFRLKSELKGSSDKIYEYMKAKNKLNSIYGMMVTDIAQDEILYDGAWGSDTTDIEKAIEKYYNSRTTFLTYQWGVWVTAHARYELQRALNIIGNDIVYVDTDCVKYIGEHDSKLDALNDDIMAEIKSAPIPPMIKVGDKLYTMGTWDDDGTYVRFKTLGAKKYVYEQRNARTGKTEIHTTVAGLSKKVGADEITKCGFESFNIGKVFYPSGNLTAWYNDDDIHTITVDGCEILTASNVCLLDSEYQLGVTNTYADVIKKARKLQK